MWQCESQAPDGAAYFGLTGFGSGAGIVFMAAGIMARPRPE